MDQAHHTRTSIRLHGSRSCAQSTEKERKINRLMKWNSLSVFVNFVEAIGVTQYEFRNAINESHRFYDDFFLKNNCLLHSFFVNNDLRSVFG